MRTLVMLALLIAGLAGAAAAGEDQVYTAPGDRQNWRDRVARALDQDWLSESRSYALVVGLSDYAGGYKELPTSNDANRMRRFLLEEAGFDYVHVLTEEKATKARIEQLMDEEFPDLVDENDRFLFYWSGHGDQRQLYGGGLRGYLPLRDSEADQWSSMISMLAIQRWDEVLEARQALYLIDACFSGLAGNASKASTADLALEQLLRPSRHIVTAGTADEEVIAGDRWGGSLFTTAVIDGFRGAADATSAYQQDGVVSLNELVGYVKLRVADEKRRAGWNAAITPQVRDLRVNQGEFFVFVPDAVAPEQPGAPSRETSDATAKGEAQPTAHEISEAQEVLLALGFDPGPSDGIIGLKTTGAILRFQREYELTLSGQLDAATLGALANAWALDDTAWGLPEDERARRVTAPELGDTNGQDGTDLPAQREYDLAPPVEPAPPVQLEPPVKLAPPAELAAAPTLGDANGGGGTEVPEPAQSATAWLDNLADFETFTDKLADGSDCPFCPEMVVIPAGTFVMGSLEDEQVRYDDEGPQREVTVPRFAIGATEVTFDQWDACVHGGGCNGYRPHDAGWGRGNRPVTNVSWKDAQAYVAWLSETTGQPYRLPSEAEWEYAARAGTTTPFWTGATISADQANFASNVRRTTPVDEFPPNPRGLHDTAGNVWEWVADCWHESYEGAPQDGSAWLAAAGGDCSRRGLRGGSWVNDPRLLRSANRYWDNPDNRLGSYGFRVARTLTP